MSDLLGRLVGSWTGANRLYLSWLPNPEFHSPSRLTATRLMQDRYLQMTYEWSHERERHEGLLLLGHDTEANVITAAWTDSWHQRKQLMFCRGSPDSDDVIKVVGEYEAPQGPPWKWRITIEPLGARELRMTMHNITPEGKEDLAVLTEYRREDATAS